MRDPYRLVPLAELCEVFTDGNWVQTKDQSPSGVRLIQTGNVGTGVFKNRLSKARFISEKTFQDMKCTEVLPGDCLVSRLPDPVGRACIIPDLGERMITAVDCSILRLDRGRILPEYFSYYAQSASYFNEVEHYCTGATRKRISRKNLGKVGVPVPALSQQKRIVAILDEAFVGIEAAIANTETNLVNAQELFLGFLKRAFDVKRHGWKESAVGDFADHCLGKMLDKRKNRGVLRPYLRNVNVRWFDVDTSDLREMKIEDAEVDRYMVQRGDLLICEGGYPGRAAIWESDEPLFFQKAVHRVRCHDTAHSRWLMYFLYLADAAGHLRSYFTGAGIQHFTGKSLKRFMVPLAPADQAIRLTAKMDELRADLGRIESTQKRKLAALRELKQSLLQKAFSGELTADSIEREVESATA